MIRKKRVGSIPKVLRLFFLCLNERKWKDVEVTMKSIQICKMSKGEEWKRGNINALNGMLIALRHKHSLPQYSIPKPFILQIINSSPTRLKKLKKLFLGQSCGIRNTDYDKGYYNAWHEYIKFLLDEKHRPDQIVTF
ncbi:hypothetical protein ES707_10321 [subsurface metagenome]